MRQTAEGVEIAVPPEHRQDLDTIVVLNLDGPAMEIKPAPILSDPLTLGRKVTASHVYDADPKVAIHYRPEYAVDGDPQSGWLQPGRPVGLA